MLNTAPQIQFSAILDFVYPVGSYFITESADYNTVAKVQAHFGGTWVQLDAGRFLEAVTSGAGSNKDAGLPNIKGTLGGDTGSTNYMVSGTRNGGQPYTAGAFAVIANVGIGGFGNGNGYSRGHTITFNAATGATTSGIYSDSVTTVQPKSRTVYMYRRTA